VDKYRYFQLLLQLKCIHGDIAGIGENKWF